MQRAVPLVVGLLMTPVCCLGLLWQQWFSWIVCPQALVVMFLRQAEQPYDSLGAADYPDLTVGVLYYPVVGWILSQAIKRDALSRSAVRVAVWHTVALIAAAAARTLRDRLWGF